MNDLVAPEVMTYFARQPEPRRQRLLVLHQAILLADSLIRVDMAYRMPTYHHGDGWVALANQKHYISLYTCGNHHIKSFKVANPGVKTGKGCINLSDRDVLSETFVAELIEVVRHAMEQPKPV